MWEVAVVSNRSFWTFMKIICQICIISFSKFRSRKSSSDQLVDCNFRNFFLDFLMYISIPTRFFCDSMLCVSFLNYM